MTNLACILTYLGTFTGAMPLTAYLQCSIGIDRLLASWMPHLYRVYSRWHLRTVFVISAFIYLHMITLALSTAPGPASVSVLCASSFAPLSPTFVTYLNSFSLVFFASSVLIYICIKFVIHLSYKKIGPITGAMPAIETWTGNTVEERFLAQQLALMPIVETLMTAYMFFAVFPHAVITMAPYVDGGRHQRRLIAHAVILKVSLGLIDFVVLAAKGEEFRFSLKVLYYRICRREIPVENWENAYSNVIVLMLLNVTWALWRALSMP